jgi:putative hemolysin
VRGGGNSNLLVTQNTFTDFHPAAGDHPDAMQLWTNNTTTSASNITFCGQSGGARHRRHRSRASSCVTSSAICRSRTSTITGNMIVGARYNGIAVEHVVGGNISGNTVAGYVGETSWMRADNSDQSVTLTNNNSTSVHLPVPECGGHQRQYADRRPSWILASACREQHGLAQHIGFSSHWGGS